MQIYNMPTIDERVYQIMKQSLILTYEKVAKFCQIDINKEKDRTTMINCLLASGYLIDGRWIVRSDRLSKEKLYR
eukprot:UN13543